MQRGMPASASIPPAATGQPRSAFLNPSASLDRALAVALQEEEREAAAQRAAAVHQQREDAQLAQAVAASQQQEQQEYAIWGEPSPSLMFPEPIYNSSHDTTLTQRLSRVPSMQIRPRVNSALLPAEPLINADRDRLLLRLDQYSLVERVVKGDGACQFRSLSDQLYGTAEHYAYVREQVVARLRSHKARYAPYVPDDFDGYVAGMSLASTWGDHVTLQAAADHFGLKITVITSYRENCVLHIEPAKKRSSRVLWLSFWAEVHYNSLYPAGELPPEAPAKVLGSRRLGRLMAGGHL